MFIRVIVLTVYSRNRVFVESLCFIIRNH